MEKKDFLPVILGTGLNAYGIARSFHEEYGIKSLVMGSGQLMETKHSKILKSLVFENFNQLEVFKQTLITQGRIFKKKANDILLIPSSDHYLEMMANCQEVLKEYYSFSVMTASVVKQLSQKESFYETCKEHNLPYPELIVVSPTNYQNVNLRFDFPVVVKPSDDVQYTKMNFQGKKKVYIISSRKEMDRVLNLIYSSGYNDNIIIQKYVDGVDSNMFVLNTYSDQSGDVKKMCLGRILIEDKSPHLKGNYLAIESSFNKEIYDQYKTFLETINYVGFANFDLKYDSSDETFKVFEMNLRPGRSSFYTTACGCNLMVSMVEDFVYENAKANTYNENKHLWINVSKKDAINYTPSAYKSLVKKYLSSNKYSTTFWYNKDKSFLRGLNLLKHNFRYKKRLKNYSKDVFGS